MNQWPTVEHRVKPRLLVVDDEPNIRSALARALDLVGYSPTEAASGQEALALLDEEAYDLMILDLIMPGISGVEVMQHARHKQPDLLIIILTGHANLESAITAVKTQVSDYLQKPSSIRQIVQAVTKALQTQPSHSQRELLVDLIDQARHVLEGPQRATPPPRFGKTQDERYVLAPPLKLDRLERTLTRLGRADRRVELTKGETAVLAHLMAHADQVRSCLQLARAIWGYGVDRTEAETLIRPYISRLRSKLEANPKEPAIIRTRRGAGYLFVSEQE